LVIQNSLLIEYGINPKNKIAKSQIVSETRQEESRQSSSLEEKLIICQNELAQAQDREKEAKNGAKFANLKA